MRSAGLQTPYRLSKSTAPSIDLYIKTALPPALMALKAFAQILDTRMAFTIRSSKPSKLVDRRSSLSLNYHFTRNTNSHNTCHR